MNHAFSKIWIMIVLIILITGGILAYKYWWMPKEEVKAPEEITTDETADWVVCKNERYHFSIKLPPSFEGCYYSDSELLYRKEKNNLEKFTSPGFKTRIEFSSLKNGPDVFGINIYNFQESKGLSPSSDLKYLGQNDSYAFYIDSYGCCSGNPREERDFIENKIAPTFNFIEDETVDWTTYQNEEYGIEFKYPPFLSRIENPSGGTLIKSVQTIVKLYKLNDLGYPDILINVTETDLNPSEWINNSLCRPLVSGKTLCAPPIGGSMLGFIQVQSEGTHFNSVDTIFKNNNVLFDISLNEKLAAPIPQDIIEIYNQILSTLQFLETETNEPGLF